MVRDSDRTLSQVIFDNIVANRHPMIGHELQYIREYAGLLEKEVAKLHNISTERLYEIENKYGDREIAKELSDTVLALILREAKK